MKTKMIYILLSLLILIPSCTPTESPPTDTPPPAPTSLPPEAAPTPTSIPISFGIISVWEAYRTVQGYDWPANTEITVIMTSKEGVQKEVISINTTSDGQLPQTEFNSVLKDGDQFTVELNDSQLQLPVRLVTVFADPENNTIKGVAEPDTRVTITFEYPAGTVNDLETMSDADGNFEFDLSSIAEWDNERHYWISHFYHPNIDTTITNESAQIRFLSRTYDSNFVTTRLNIPDLSTSGTGNYLIDFDTDGDLDLILNQFDWPPPQDSLPVLAFRNNGKGNFSDATVEVFGGTSLETTNARHWAVQDFNGDELEDLFIAESGIDHPPFGGGQSLLLIQNEEGQLIDETQTRIPQHPAFTHHVSAGDIDNDGDVDIYMCNIWGSEYGPAIYLNDGSGYFIEDATRIPSIITNLEKVYLASILLDVDNDGDLDLFLGGAGTVQDAILINDGSGFFTHAPADSLPPRLGGSESQTVAVNSVDFNNDGWLDLVTSINVDYQSDITMQLFYNNGDGTYRDETSLINQDWVNDRKPGCEMAYGSGWLIWLFIVDYNDDGWSDILVQGASCMLSLLFANDHGESFSIAENYNEVAREESFGTSYLWGLVPGDLDGDNDLDLVILTTSVGQLVVLRE